MLSSLPSVIMGIILIGLSVISVLFFTYSIREKENRASVFGGIQSMFFLACLASFLVAYQSGYFITSTGSALLRGMIGITTIGLWVFLGRIGKNIKALDGTSGLMISEVKRFDERETVFARDNLQPGTQAYKEMYQKHPEWEERDAKRRAMGGVLGDMGAIDRPAGDANLAGAFSSVILPDYLSQAHMIRPMNFLGKKIEISPEEATLKVKGFARQLGADLVGIARTNPLWTYSHRGMDGRQEDEKWGTPLDVSHEYTIVIATEMAFELVQAAPHTAGTIETARNYAEGASISIRLAQYIANLGYSATAEHMRYYQSLLVPMAVDAGMGELGRHGYLITKELGPRLRLAGVTTDLPLIPDKPVDIGVYDFCTICKKCADCCPSGSIPRGAAEEFNGTLRWGINAETCHDYWAKVGTDCNICMRVCPWSHDKTFPHRVITEAVSRNKNARRLFLKMDDLFYGRKPKAKSAPAWASYAA
jgi:reductive dehalogenase